MNPIRKFRYFNLNYYLASIPIYKILYILERDYQKTNVYLNKIIDTHNIKSN